MTSLTTKAAEIRAGLVAGWRKAMEGVSAGPWRHYRNKLRPNFGGIINEVQCRSKTPVVAWPGFEDGKRKEAAHARNAAWIARCSPAGIAPLLALIEQQAAELAEARVENERVKSRSAEIWDELLDLKAIEADARAKLTSAESERDELLREKERLGAGWLPIETAPTDYTHVIGMDAKGNVSRTWFFAPSSITRDWLKVPGSGKWKPIYWMPLLEPDVGSGQNLADANSKSPDPSSQSVRIAVLEAAGREIRTLVDEYDPKNSDWYFRRTVIRELLARSALAPLGEE